MIRRNRNLNFLKDCEADGIRGAVLEGASRSGKTWSSIDFIIYLCARESKINIIIVRETYNSFKTTLYSDFNRRLPDAGFISPFEMSRDVSTFWLFGNKISLMGADNPAKFHGAGSDYFFINEALDTPQNIFDQLEQRCRRFWWLDYNPKVTDHWIYNRVCNRPDVRVFKSTFDDNPKISPQERTKILSYEPNTANQKAGTADGYMWKVYGLGERAAMEGLIFPNVTWIDDFPQDIELISYGLDFGYTQDPTALVRVGRNGMNLFIQKLIYVPIDNANDLADTIKQVMPETAFVYCDSADPGMIASLRVRKINALIAKKYSGSVKDGIDILKRFKLHLVRDKDLRKEQENYKYRYISGIALNEPEDKFNHCWDAARYATQSHFRI